MIITLFMEQAMILKMKIFPRDRKKRAEGDLNFAHSPVVIPTK